MQLGFGSGIAVGTPTIDVNGNSIAVPTPTRFGVIQDTSVDFSFDMKELFGGYQFPIAIGRGKGKISGKSKFAQLNGVMLNNLVFGATYTNLLLNDYIDSTGTPAAATVTPTVPNSGTFQVDLGVCYQSNQRPLTRVVSAPAVGQYSLTAGVYTFAAADVGAIMLISYQWTATSSIAKKMTIPNSLMGVAPQFRLDLMIPYQGNQFVMTLGACTAAKLTIATKMDDFLIPEFDFSVFADAAGNIAYLSLAE